MDGSRESNPLQKPMWTLGGTCQVGVRLDMWVRFHLQDQHLTELVFLNMTKEAFAREQPPSSSWRIAPVRVANFTCQWYVLHLSSVFLSTLQ
jgi:hypothetical protein